MNTTTEMLGTDFGPMMDRAKELVANGENENVIVIIAKKDGNFHALTDIETPLTISVTMMQGAAQAFFEAKKKRVQDTQGSPEIVES